MSAEKQRSSRERYVWLALVSVLFIATATSLVSSSIQISGSLQKLEDLQKETEVVQSEISSFAKAADEYEQLTEVVTSCGQRLENLRLGRLEYLMAVTMLLEQVSNMTNYGIFSGDPSSIFIVAPQAIEGGQEYVRIANGFQC